MNEPHATAQRRIRSRRRWVLAIALAAIVLLAEFAWFSAPVQDWYLGRQDLSSLRRLRRSSPGSVPVRYFYARALLAAGQPTTALEEARDGTVMDRRSARTFRIAGLAADSLGDARLGWEYLARARALGDRSESMFEAMAAIQMERERMADALDLAEESTRLHPGAAESWFLLGRCRGALGMPGGWIDAARRAASLRPEQSRYWLGLMEALLFSDRPGEALAAAGRAVSLAPGDPDAWLGQARCLARSSEPAAAAQAESAFRRALDLADRDPGRRAVALREFGRFLLDTGRPAAALAPLTTANSLEPEDQKAAYWLGQALRRTGADRQAEIVLRRFAAESQRLRDLRYLRARVNADPGRVELRLLYARALAAAGRAPEAEAQFHRAAALRKRAASDPGGPSGGQL